MNQGFPGGSDGKESTCNAGDLGLIPGLGRSPGGGHGNSLQYACLENPHAPIIPGIAKSWTQLRDFIFEIASKYCILDFFVDHDGYSISSEGFLPAVVDVRG